jgi:hypothetical protein
VGLSRQEKKIQTRYFSVQFVAHLKIHAPGALEEGRSGTALLRRALIPFPPFVYVVMNLITTERCL